MLKVIERTTKNNIKEISLPSHKTINNKRMADFKLSITQTLASEDLSLFQELIEGYAQEQDIPVAQVAAALAKLAHGDTPFLLSAPKNEKTTKIKTAGNVRSIQNERLIRKDLSEEKHLSVKKQEPKQIKKPSRRKEAIIIPLETGMERYRIEVGQRHGIRAGNIVGAISNEAGLDSKHIGHIDINEEFSFVDLPYGMPTEIFTLLKKTWVKSQRMDISKCA